MKAESLRPFFEQINPSAANILRINCGGTRLETTRETLCSQPNSRLAALFSGSFLLREDQNGYVFIDRDGKAFEELISWLRDPLSNISDRGYAEARFWQVVVNNKPEPKKNDLMKISQDKMILLANCSKALAVPNCDLTGLYFGGMKLEKANFMGSILEEANFSVADLTNVNFRKCNLKFANFQSSKVSLANFEGANLEGANFQSSNVSGTNFKGANLEGAKLEGAKFEFCKFDSEIFYFYPKSFFCIFFKESALSQFQRHFDRRN